MAVSIGLGAIAGILSVVVALEIAQFGYLWRLNTRTVRTEERSKDNAQKVQKYHGD